MHENQEPKNKINLVQVIQENAQMKADIVTFITVVQGAFKSMGIDMNELGGGKDFGQILGKVLPTLTVKLGTGGFNDGAFAKFNELTPILERYKTLEIPLNDTNEPVK